MANFTELNTSNRDIYQSIISPEGTVKHGARSNKRLSMINWDLIKNKNVIDLGCNNGMLCLEASRRGASKVIGIEKTKAAKMAREQAMFEELTNINIFQLDIESPEFYNFITERFNIIFFCAMLNHIKDKQRILEWIDIHCNDILFYETNFENNQDKHIDFVIKHTSFSSYKFLGNSGDRKPEDYKLFMFRRNSHEQGGPFDHIPITFLPIEYIKLGVGSVEDFSGNKYISERAKVDKLKENIKRNGLREPIWVVNLKNSYKVKEGGHRFLAIKELGYPAIPARIIGEK